MKQFPSVDIGLCNSCLGCIAIAPSVFQLNEITGCIEVLDMEGYPEELVGEAITNCPKKCISWEMGE